MRSFRIASVTITYNFVKQVLLFGVVPILAYLFYEWTLTETLQYYLAELLAFTFFTLVNSILRKEDIINTIFELALDCSYIYLLASVSMLIIGIQDPDVRLIDKETTNSFIMGSLSYLLLIIPFEGLYLLAFENRLERTAHFTLQNHSLLWYKYAAQLLIPALFVAIFTWGDSPNVLPLLVIVCGRLVIEFAVDRNTEKKQKRNIKN